MSDTVIKVEGLWKEYRLGVIGHGTFFREVQSWMAALMKREDPNKRIQSGNIAFRDDWNVSKADAKIVERPGYFWALRDINLEVKRGEIMGIIGRNGAGKSTLLKLLSRVTAPTKGEIRIRGRLASLLEVGTGFHPELTGRENIFLNGSFLGMSQGEIRSKFEEIVEFAELGQFIDTPVKRYSSGMYMRLAFSVAAHLEPDIMVVDEVLAVGDAAFQQKCMGKMGGVAKSGRTVILISHNMNSINSLCSNAILLKRGQIIKQGPPLELTSQYLSQEGPEEGEISWPDTSKAPGDERACLRSVRIYQEPDRQSTGEVDNGRDICIEIKYENFEAGQRLYAALHLLDHMGAPLFSSCSLKGSNLTEDEWAYKPHHVGVFTSVCRIPKYWLNNLTYSITPILGRYPIRGVAIEAGALSFRVSDDGDMSQIDTNPSCGILRPKLAWQTVH